MTQVKIDLSYLSQWFIPTPHLPAVERSVSAAIAEAERVKNEYKWTYRKHVERLNVAAWCDVFTAADRSYVISTATTQYDMSYTRLRQICTYAYANVPDGELRRSAAAAATSLMQWIDRTMMCGTRVKDRPVLGIAQLLNSVGATTEVVSEEVERRARAGTLPSRWSAARAVVAIELEQMPPILVKDDAGEPKLVMTLMARIAGVVPDALGVP